jgi:hypothetical protein
VRMADQLRAEAHRFLDWAREQGAGLDGTDESIWFVQGILESMAEDADEEPSLRAVKFLAYSVYLAEMLADTCSDVRCAIESEGMGLRDVLAVHEGGSVQFTLSWVQSCVNDPRADNIGFKYAGALRDFGEQERASRIYQQLEQYNQYR